MRNVGRALSFVAGAWAVSTLAAGLSPGTPAREGAPKGAFDEKVRPILEARCQPCHFAGGKMYARLPFDRPETIRKLGSARLFTRLKDEKERAVVRAFLGEAAPK